MTATRDSDRILRAWLDLMPDEAPDRSLHAVLDQIDHTPQVRRPLVVGGWRFSVMPRVLLASALAALAVVVGAIALMPRLAPGVGGSPTPGNPSEAPTGSGPERPSASAPSSGVAGSATVPESLRHTWISGHRDIAGLEPDAGTVLLVDGDGISFAQSNVSTRRYLVSTPTDLGAGRLRLVAGDSGPCANGAVGTYSWALDSTGRILTIMSEEDACAQREAAFPGTWNLVGCHDTGTNCLGLLGAGTYRSQYVRPILGPTERWAPKAGAVTYTVPDGWANYTDYPNALGLTTADEFGATTAADWSPRDSVEIRTQVVATDPSVPCSDQPASGVEATPEAFVRHLRTVPGLTVGPSTATSVGDLPAIRVDLQVDDGKVRPCDGERIVGYMVSGEGQAIGESMGQRLIVTSPAPGSLVVIRIEVQDLSGLDAFAAAAEPIVRSIRFK
jgi:hypothetical protein